MYYNLCAIKSVVIETFGHIQMASQPAHLPVSVWPSEEVWWLRRNNGQRVTAGTVVVCGNKFIVIVDEQWAAASHIPPLPGHRPDRAESECLLLKVPPSWIRGGWRQRRRHHSMAVKWLFWRHLSYFPLNWAKLTIVYHSVLRHNILTLKRWNFSNSPLLKTANFASRLLRPPRQSSAWMSSVA